MSSRQKMKEQAREQRLAAERAEAARMTRRTRLTRLGIVLGIALVAVVAIVIVSSGGDEDGGGGSELTGVADGRAMLQGIPQDGSRLGDPDAPVVLTEYADLQCPFCAQYATQVLPQIIESYVRPGRLRLEMRLLRFIGPDSDRGARAAIVAAEQDRMWDFVDLFYRNQGAEGTGYATDEFLGDIADAVGVPREQAIAGISAQETEPPIVTAEQEAQAAGIDSTPSFLIGEQAGQGRPLEVPALTFEAFARAIEPELE